MNETHVPQPRTPIMMRVLKYPMLPPQPSPAMHRPKTCGKGNRHRWRGRSMGRARRGQMGGKRVEAHGRSVCSAGMVLNASRARAWNHSWHRETARASDARAARAPRSGGRMRRRSAGMSSSGAYSRRLAATQGIGCRRRAHPRPSRCRRIRAIGRWRVSRRRCRAAGSSSRPCA